MKTLKKDNNRVAYFDCSSGISGDMCLGALIDAGAPCDEIIRFLKKLPVRGYTLTAQKVMRGGITATKADVILASKKGKHAHEARRWEDIEKIIESSSLNEGIKQSGKDIFIALFEAEAKVHGSKPSEVHLHELGAVDCLIDIFGTLIALDLLGIKEVHASPLNLGSGQVNTEHGILPVPAPATAELIKGIPAYSSDIAFELTTPTGAAIIRTIAQGFGTMPLLIPEATGSGAGGRDFAGRPNILRVFAGKRADELSPEKVTVIETNIDDMNPQIYEYLFERLFALGALDVFMTQVIAKKTRPGILLTILCRGEKRDLLIREVLRETTSIGLRFHEISRVTMERRIEKIQTDYGMVKVKVSTFEGSHSRITPEYEDCRAIAEREGTTLLEVIETVRKNRKKKKEVDPGNRTVV